MFREKVMILSSFTFLLQQKVCKVVTYLSVNGSTSDWLRQIPSGLAAWEIRITSLILEVSQLQEQVDKSVCNFSEMEYYNVETE